MKVPVRHFIRFISLLYSVTCGSLMHLWCGNMHTVKCHFKRYLHSGAIAKAQDRPKNCLKVRQRSEQEKWLEGLPHTEGGGANMGLFCPKNGPIFHLAESTTIFHLVHYTVDSTRGTHIPPPSPEPSCPKNVPKILLNLSCDGPTFHSAEQNHLSLANQPHSTHFASHFAPL